MAETVEELRLFTSTLNYNPDRPGRGYQIARPILGTMRGEWKQKLKAAIAVLRGEAFAVRWY